MPLARPRQHRVNRPAILWSAAAEGGNFCVGQSRVRYPCRSRGGSWGHGVGGQQGTRVCSSSQQQTAVSSSQQQPAASSSYQACTSTCMAPGSVAAASSRQQPAAVSSSQQQPAASSSYQACTSTCMAPGSVAAASSSQQLAAASSSYQACTSTCMAPGSVAAASSRQQTADSSQQQPAESYLHLSSRGRGSHTNAPKEPAPIRKEIMMAQR